MMTLDGVRKHKHGPGRCCTALAVVAVCAAMLAESLPAGEVQLKNGTVLSGKLVPLQNLSAITPSSPGPTKTYPILMIDNGVTRYFVSDNQVVPESINRDLQLSPFDEFTLPQRSRGHKTVMRVGVFRRVDDFSPHGRRTVTLTGPGGELLEVVQGVTRITPQYLSIEALNYEWEYALATTSIPHDQLDAMLRQATDQDSPADRMSIARFYLQSGMYLEAMGELDAITEKFPDYSAKAEEINLKVRQEYAKQLLAELRRRRDVGQHRLAFRAAQQFPTRNMAAEVLREVRELMDYYEERRARGERAIALLGDLQSQLEDEELTAAVAPMRVVVRDQLDMESLDRLEAFLQFADDDTHSPEEKLALAYSGWVVGSARATTNIAHVIRLWKARFLILDYLRKQSGNERTDVLQRLMTVEDIGPEGVSQLIPYLPPVLESIGIEPGVASRVDVVGAEQGDIPVSYSVLLPEEYTPHHRYPLIVALHSELRPAERELAWWGGTKENPKQSQRRGYIVIAPHYVSDGAREYDYSSTAHYVIERSLVDARKRFNVDSDRVFLSGHGMGGDAAFDVAMSHPDWFAGVIPITGRLDRYCTYYWNNSHGVPWYVVGGELDRDTVEHNARDLNRMLRYNFDLIYAEYIGRGYETYYEEIHKLFDWMDARRRPPLPRDIEMKVLRPTDNRFYFVEADGFPRNVTRPIVWLNGRGRSVSPMTLSVHMRDGSDDRTTLFVRSGADRHTLWLSPDQIDFQKRLTVRLNGRQVHNDFVTPDVADMLEDFRRRGDRQRLFTAKLEFD